MADTQKMLSAKHETISIFFTCNVFYIAFCLNLDGYHYYLEYMHKEQSLFCFICYLRKELGLGLQVFLVYLTMSIQMDMRCYDPMSIKMDTLFFMI